MKIIPAIDIIDGKCVRLSQGAYDSKKIYSEKPLEMAKQFEDAGIQNLQNVQTRKHNSCEPKLYQNKYYLHIKCILL